MFNQIPVFTIIVKAGIFIFITMTEGRKKFEELLSRLRKIREEHLARKRQSIENAKAKLSADDITEKEDVVAEQPAVKKLKKSSSKKK